MTKKLISMVVVVVIALSISCVSVFAVTPGYSDFGSPESKPVVAGEKISLTSTSTGAAIDLPAGTLPAGVTSVSFGAMKSTNPAASKAATDAGFKNAVILDLKLFDQNGAAISKLNGKVKITLKLEGDVNTVLFFNEATGKVENLGGTISNGYITFETDHFSYYMMAKTEKASNGAQTGDYAMNIVIICGALCVLAAGGAFAVLKIKKAK